MKDILKLHDKCHTENVALHARLARGSSHAKTCMLIGDSGAGATELKFIYSEDKPEDSTTPCLKTDINCRAPLASSKS